MARLSRFQAVLDEGLEGLGFSCETRPFTPHLTLARVGVRVVLRSDSKKFIKYLLTNPPARRVLSDFTADSFRLIKSDLHRSASICTPLITTTFRS